MLSVSGIREGEAETRLQVVTPFRIAEDDNVRNRRSHEVIAVISVDLTVQVVLGSMAALVLRAPSHALEDALTKVFRRAS